MELYFTENIGMGLSMLPLRDLCATMEPVGKALQYEYSRNFCFRIDIVYSLESNKLTLGFPGSIEDRITGSNPNRDKMTQHMTLELGGHTFHSNVIEPFDEDLPNYLSEK